MSSSRRTWLTRRVPTLSSVESILATDALEASAIGFYTWLEKTFPPEPGVRWAHLEFMSAGFKWAPPRVSVSRQYLTGELMVSSKCWQLRPYQLPHRADFGLRGTADSVSVSVQSLQSHAEMDSLIVQGGPIESRFADSSQRLYEQC